MCVFLNEYSRQSPLQWPGPSGRDGHSAADGVRRQAGEEDAHQEEHAHHIWRVEGHRRHYVIAISLAASSVAAGFQKASSLPLQYPVGKSEQ